MVRLQTELRMVAAVKRSGTLKRKKWMRVVPSKRLDPGRPLATWCEAKIDGCFGRAVLRHEKLRRSQGGKGNPENTMDLCAFCSLYIHDHPAWARERGFLLRSTDR